MNKNVRFEYDSEVFDTVFPMAVMENDELFERKVNLVKSMFAETLVVKRWLKEGKIVPENCLVNDDGETTNHIARKTLTSGQESELNKAIDVTAKGIMCYRL